MKVGGEVVIWGVGVSDSRRAFQLRLAECWNERGTRSDELDERVT